MLSEARNDSFWGKGSFNDFISSWFYSKMNPKLPVDYIVIQKTPAMNLNKELTFFHM